jgi:hypothetical protein
MELSRHDACDILARLSVASSICKELLQQPGDAPTSIRDNGTASSTERVHHTSGLQTVVRDK